MEANWIIILTILCSYCVIAQNECTAYTGGPGNCVPLPDCPDLMRKLKTKNGQTIVRNYNCGFVNDIPKVCCPSSEGNTCMTPEGRVGTCTDIFECGYLKDMLQNGNIMYLKQSKCESSVAKQAVCCDRNKQPHKTTATTIQPSLLASRRKTCILSAFPPDRQSGCCGRDTMFKNKVIGGNATPIDAYPWLVAIEGERDGKIVCGGSLISGKYVLSAAHCFISPQGEPIRIKYVRVGEYDISNEVGRPDCVEVNGGGQDCTDGARYVRIENVIVHNGYDYNKVYKPNDIALVRLAETVDYTDFIRPICLPTTDISTAISRGTDLKLEVVGWGATNSDNQVRSDIKQAVEIMFHSTQDCQLRYNRGNEKLTESNICAESEGKDSCSGDSGGPLMREVGHTMELVGVVSWGTKFCAVKNWPGIYTKVYDYLDWIERNMHE